MCPPHERGGRPANERGGLRVVTDDFVAYFTVALRRAWSLLQGRHLPAR
jgi:hypothetical protein